MFHYDGEMTDDAQKDIIRELGAKIRMVEGVGKVDGAWKVSCRFSFLFKLQLIRSELADQRNGYHPIQLSRGTIPRLR